MSSWESAEESSDGSAAVTPHEVKVGDFLHSIFSSYAVQEFIGEGTFAKIAASMNLRTKQHVAIKILKDKAYINNTVCEVSVLEHIRDLDCDRTNMIKFHEQFVYMEQVCLVFERLDLSLYDLMEQGGWKYIPLHQIRPVAKQVLVALDALKGHSVLHADIKPDNIMFVHMQDQPLRVKLIDFGCAMKTSQIRQGMQIQPFGYRAPEICLGLKFTEAIDVWGVGCVLAFLYMAENLFSIYSEYQMMKDIVNAMGQPEDRFLRDGKHSWMYFIEEHGEGSSSWRLMYAEEFRYFHNKEVKDLPSSLTPLSSLIHFHPKLEPAEMEDRRAFVSLLERLLHLDGDQRISPGQALQHPFITMSHLRQDVDSRDYLATSEEAMRVCPNEDRVHCKISDSDSVNVLDSASSPRPSIGDLHTSAEALDSDLSISRDSRVLVKEDVDANDQKTLSIDTTLSSLFNDTMELSRNPDVAVDVTAVATASKGSIGKVLRRIRRFFSSLTSNWFTKKETPIHTNRHSCSAH